MSPRGPSPSEDLELTELRRRPGEPPRWLLIAALIMTGLSMRTAVTSVGAGLTSLRHELHVSGYLLGVVTTLPVLCFSLIGPVTPSLARRLGAHTLLVGALTVMTTGLALRALVGSVWLFLVLSVLALAGGAVSNVLMPSLVKQHFPNRIGTMTAVYTTALAVGLTAGAGLTVPIGDLGGGWRFGLGSWALLSLLAVLPWLLLLRGDRAASDASDGGPRRRLVLSRDVWAMTFYFGSQSFQAYIAFGWFETFLQDRGLNPGHAGLAVAYFAALSIPMSIMVPTIAGRGGARPLLVSFTACYALAYAGLLLAPAKGVWLWMTLGGLASGGSFPLALTLIALRARDRDATAALSAFTQSVGYILAGTGPLLVGLLLGPRHDWKWPFVALFIALTVLLISGWRACASGYVGEGHGAPAERLPTTSGSPAAH